MFTTPWYEQMLDFPINMIIETASRCNLKCVMCPQALSRDDEHSVKRPKFMEEDLINKIIPMMGTLKAAQLHGIGEPLISPSFWKLLKHIAKDCWADVNTNLTILTDQMIDDLLNSNLKVLNVSLDAANKETYQKIRMYDFDTVLNNLSNFIDEKKSRQQKYPMVYTNMTLMKENIHQIVDFMNLTIGKLGCDTVKVWPMNNWGKEANSHYDKSYKDWIFIYEEQGLWDYEFTYNQKIREAKAYAEKKGWDFIGYEFGQLSTCEIR
jgi:MoaA/NifB/PqqE/SkfB family radical SAM enzyme